MEKRLSIKRVVLAAAVCGSLVAIASPAAASEWYAYTGSSKFGHLLADKAGIVENGDTQKFWAAQLPLNPKSGQPVYTKTVYAVNCKQRTYSIVQSTAYDANEVGSDMPVTAGAREVEPDSKEDALAGFACGLKSNAWEFVNNVPEYLHARAYRVKQGVAE
jgi:hypothetical protein